VLADVAEVINVAATQVRDDERPRAFTLPLCSAL
jgi:hypothetical protein